MRYHVHYTSMNHPWAMRYSAGQGKTVPKVVEGFHVYDTQEKKSASEPTTKVAAVHERARELNELPALNVAKVCAILRRAQHTISTSHATRVRGWHHITRGASVQWERDGRVAVSYTQALSMGRSSSDEEIAANVAKYRAALEAAGHAVTETDGVLYL